MKTLYVPAVKLSRPLGGVHIKFTTKVLRFNSGKELDKYLKRGFNSVFLGYTEHRELVRDNQVWFIAAPDFKKVARDRTEDFYLYSPPRGVYSGLQPAFYIFMGIRCRDDWSGSKDAPYLGYRPRKRAKKIFRLEFKTGKELTEYLSAGFGALGIYYKDKIAGREPWAIESVDFVHACDAGCLILTNFNGLEVFRSTNFIGKPISNKKEVLQYKDDTTLYCKDEGYAYPEDSSYPLNSGRKSHKGGKN